MGGWAGACTCEEGYGVACEVPVNCLKALQLLKTSPGFLRFLPHVPCVAHWYISLRQFLAAP